MFPQLFGKYVLERELASGGMAIIYLATLRGAGGFEKRLVVKQIRAELASDQAFVERFVAEAKTTVELSHPNIVPVYELGVEQGVYFIAMELAQGVTLSELLKAGGELSPEEGAYLGVEVCRALDYAHRRAGVVHRDVTPRNVLIDDEGAVRVIDFGIAAPVTVAGTARERVFGSPGHMPIEQLKGGRLTPATDVFAVAALLLEAWTNEPPFRRATKEESDQALTEPPPRLSLKRPALSPLDELFERALSADASARPQSAEDLARPLREFLRTADLGDIARRLGERVGRARRASLPRAPGATAGTPSTPAAGPRSGSGGTLLPAGARRAGSDGPMTPATRPLPQPATETFATRSEVVEWTRASSRPPARVGGSIPPPQAQRVAGRAKPRWALGLAAAAALLLLVALGLRGSPPNADPVRVSPVSTTPAAPPAPMPSPTASALPSMAAAERPAPAASAAEQAPPKGGLGTLSFTSDLLAKVSVDGAVLGTTPIRNVKKAPGAHVVVFTAVSLGEPLTTTVVVQSGRTLGVHAEFRGASPRLVLR